MYDSRTSPVVVEVHKDDTNVRYQISLRGPVPEQFRLHQDERGSFDFYREARLAAKDIVKRLRSYGARVVEEID